MNSMIWLIPFFPLLGFLINGIGGKRLSERMSGIVASVVVGLSFVIGISLFGEFLKIGTPLEQTLFTWIEVGNFTVSFSYVLDSLSLVMVLVVTGVGLLIHIYSIGYMKGDPGIQRYFSYLNLFTFMMLTLVMSDNFLAMFLGWEGVGLCSYLLIGFWFEDPVKAAAGKKAFIVNRIGDFGFMLAMFLIVSKFGTLQFANVLDETSIANLTPEIVTAITLLLFLGAVGKSAQIPLHIWLPDAMAGPTPVSALIHAATMVTAGVYLIARCGILFAASEITMLVIAVIGILTAFFAATIALTETDIKKVLAYSTISQLGYMFAAVGVGAFAAGIFHLVTHAFFKGLLFLAAGSVIHGMSGEQNMLKMGGLKQKMPTTYWTMLAGVAAISGLPLLSGFFSKDEILWNVYSSQFGGNVLFGIGLFTAAMTAFYMFRLFFMTFHGDRRWSGEVSPHESPKIMTIPLIILAVLSVVGGFIGIPESLGGHNFFHQFLQKSTQDATGYITHHYSSGLLLSENILMILSIAAAIGGLLLAYRFYVQRPDIPGKISKSLSIAYKLVSGKYFIDELYGFFFVRPLRNGSELFWKKFDISVIDGIANGSGKVMLVLGNKLRRIQTGVIQNYAAVIFLGVISIIFYLYLK